MNCLACFAVAQSASSGASASPKMITFGIAALAASGDSQHMGHSQRARPKAHAGACQCSGRDWLYVRWRNSHILSANSVLWQRAQPKYENIMTGDRAGLIVSLFDYSFTVGPGKSQQTCTQTVANFSKGPPFPSRFRAAASESAIQGVGCDGAQQYSF